MEGNCPSVDLAGGGITDGQSLVVAMQRKSRVCLWPRMDGHIDFSSTEVVKYICGQIRRCSILLLFFCLPLGRSNRLVD